MTIGAILKHLAVRVWWRLVDSPYRRSEDERRQNRNYVTLASIEEALRREAEERRDSSKVVEFDHRDRRAMWRGR